MVLQWYTVLSNRNSMNANPMIKNLCKHGNSLALVIDRPILELLGIDEHTSLEISTDGESLVIAPVRDEQRRKRFEEALASSNERYGGALKRLAE